MYRIMRLRPHPEVEPATAGGAVDGGVEIKLLGRALAGEAAEATERDLDVPGAELLRIVEIPELALVPDLDGATLSPAVLADADAFRIVAIGAERGGAAGADPLAAALVPPLLLPQSCFRSEEHTSELQSLMRISYAVFCLKKKKMNTQD